MERSDLPVSPLTYIPPVFAGWFRYLIGTDDEGNTFEPSPDPLLQQLRERFKGLSVGNLNHIRTFA